MCSGLPTQLDRTFFQRYLSGMLRPVHIALLRGYFRWVRIVTTAPTLDGIEIDGCAVDVCDCRLVVGKCLDRIDVCYKLDRQGEAPYDRRAMSEDMLRRGRARLYIFTAGHKWELCHCCPCCCLILMLVKLCGEPFIHPSGQLPTRGPAACTECGKCATACPLNLRTIDAVINPEQCIGCGVCVAACPQGAWEMQQAAPPPTLPCPPRWWSYIFGSLYLGYLNFLVLVYAIFPQRVAHKVT
jgi:NAD-dependent dihydropyrimidine dehydrogenase PreA subunit